MALLFLSSICAVIVHQPADRIAVLLIGHGVHAGEVAFRAAGEGPSHAVELLATAGGGQETSPITRSTIRAGAASPLSIGDSIGPGGWRFAGGSGGATTWLNLVPYWRLNGQV
ncbi:hypothetical protein [Sphingomonas qomolangmaensis]|uniref:Uncharacterized protein n=1 Tax=Sphingomonas qomolangmaensis TaxID=2918765 RepID=A0ABY5L6A5_9SPHN|nr:hypothetical protein [Sphingomonas qomolangmaensis]UUL82498.1 hypothetical protein NMP03_15215 [Sphingomonas qomolangmaensis]